VLGPGWPVTSSRPTSIVAMGGGPASERLRY